MLFIEAFILTFLITGYVVAQNYFTMSWELSLQTVFLMLFLAYTYSLTIGAWNKTEQYIIVPLPISLAIFTAVLQYNFSYAVLAFILSFLLLTLDIYKATRIKNLLIRFDPKIILRLSTTGILFLFSILGAVLVILHSASVQTELNIGHKIAEVVEAPLKNVVKGQLESSFQDQSMLIPGYELDFSNIDPSYLPFLEQAGISNPNDLKDIAKTSATEQIYDKINVGSIVENQVNNYIEPYKGLIRPLMAILVFGLFQFYATIAMLIFMATVDILFMIAKSSKFFNIIEFDVKKEELKF